MTRMNPEVRTEWLRRLRSREYVQGRGRLRYVTTLGTGTQARYCCLGVLCEAAVDAGVVERVNLHDLWTYRDPANHADSSYNFIPLIVRNWAGLEHDADPRVDGHVLSTWNDDRNASFGQIADLIEEHL